MAGPGVESRSLDADAIPGTGMVRENQGGDHSQAQPHRAAQTSQNAPARPAASGERRAPRPARDGGVLGLPAGDADINRGHLFGQGSRADEDARHFVEFRVGVLGVAT